MMNSAIRFVSLTLAGSLLGGCIVSGGVSYGGHSRPIYSAPVLVQQPVMTRQVIAVCDRGGVLTANGRCQTPWVRVR